MNILITSVTIVKFCLMLVRFCNWTAVLSGQLVLYVWRLMCVCLSVYVRWVLNLHSDVYILVTCVSYKQPLEATPLLDAVSCFVLLLIRLSSHCLWLESRIYYLTDTHHTNLSIHGMFGLLWTTRLFHDGMYGKQGGGGKENSYASIGLQYEGGAKLVWANIIQYHVM